MLPLLTTKLCTHFIVDTRREEQEICVSLCIDFLHMMLYVFLVVLLAPFRANALHEVGLSPSSYVKERNGLEKRRTIQQLKEETTWK
jgi:hypothetical protein